MDSIDLSVMNLVLPEGRFAVNIWSKEDIDVVLASDMQPDGKSYGKLQVIFVFLYFLVECLLHD